MVIIQYPSGKIRKEFKFLSVGFVILTFMSISCGSFSLCHRKDGLLKFLKEQKKWEAFQYIWYCHPIALLNREQNITTIKLGDPMPTGSLRWRDTPQDLPVN